MMYPLAPILSALLMYSSSRKVVRKSIADFEPFLMILSAASVPFIPSIRISMTMTSGSSEDASFTASSPEPATALTSMSGSLSRIIFSDPDTKGSSSTIITLIMSFPLLRYRHHNGKAALIRHHTRASACGLRSRCDVVKTDAAVGRTAEVVFSYLIAAVIKYLHAPE